MFFITSAFADTKSAQTTNGFGSLITLVALFAIMYFLLIRPQQKKQKQHQELIKKIKVGDKVMTNSGLIATVAKLPNDNEVVLEIAEGTKCKFVRSTIVQVISTQEANENKAN